MSQQASPATLFNWEDPLHLEDQLSEEERMIRGTANSYCQERLLPRILEANHDIHALILGRAQTGIQAFC